MRLMFLVDFWFVHTYAVAGYSIFLFILFSSQMNITIPHHGKICKKGQKVGDSSPKPDWRGKDFLQGKEQQRQ